jgi:hypothetical protein
VSVYFIEADMPGSPVKIGWTNRRPEERLIDLRVGTPVALHLLGVIPGDEHLEAMLHRHFADHHVRGEWFSLTREDVEKLLALAEGVPLVGLKLILRPG